jgi:hypothetical protein
VAAAKLFGIYPLGDLVWLAVQFLIGTAILDIGENIAPSVGSWIGKKYKGTMVVDWCEISRATIAVAILSVAWFFIAGSVESLARALQSSSNPGIILASYNVLFALAIGYYAISGAIKSRAPKEKRPEALGEVSWSGWEEAATMSRYLSRLEALRTLGDLDDRTYEKLRAEYEGKLKQAIELS